MGYAKGIKYTVYIFIFLHTCIYVLYTYKLSYVKHIYTSFIYFRVIILALTVEGDG